MKEVANSWDPKVMNARSRHKISLKNGVALQWCIVLYNDHAIACKCMHAKPELTCFKRSDFCAGNQQSQSNFDQEF